MMEMGGDLLKARLCYLRSELVLTHQAMLHRLESHNNRIFVAYAQLLEDRHKHAI